MNTPCRGILGILAFQTALGARLSGSAKKVSEPTSATCSPPSDSRLPEREVSEGDAGRYQERTVAISTQAEGVQEATCWLAAPSDASCVRLNDSLHLLYYPQA